MVDRLALHPPIDRPQQWPELATGMLLDIEKVDYSGEIKARYTGRIVDTGQPAPWLAVQCAWVLPTVESDGLLLIPGDVLIEFFSPEHPFNVFRVHAPDGALRGWYANVTYPTVVQDGTLAWHDLWLDLIVRADGSFVVRDQDELVESGIEQVDPALHAAVVMACNELVRLAEAREFPFTLP
jgi:predicted RNA-binding protein associated with RNAse of E/G family